MTLGCLPVEFQLLSPSRKVPVDKGWIFQRKYDGHRAQLLAGAGQVTLLSRGGHDYTSRFPEIVEAARGIGSEVILDGELTAMLEDERDDLGALARSSHGHARVVFQAFDLLALNGKPIQNFPLLSRKHLLETAVGERSIAEIRPVHYVWSGSSLAEQCRAAGFEGIVAKREDCIYQPGRRSTSWLKIKNRRTGLFRALGWNAGPNRTLSSLILGTRSRSSSFCGCVGTGYTETERVSLLRELRALPLRGSASAAVPRSAAQRASGWLRDIVLVEVSYLEMGASGMLREPSFVRITR